MATPALQLKIKSLIDRLVDFHRVGSCDEIALRKMRMEVEQLLPKNPGDAHMALGMIACLEDKEANAMKEHEAALRCGWDTQRARNYAVTLRHFYRYEDAIHQIRNVMDYDPLDIEAMYVGVFIAYESGRFRLAAQTLASYSQCVQGELTGFFEKIQADLPDILQAIEYLKLTDDALSKMQQPAWDLVRTIGAGKNVTIEDDVGNDGEVFVNRTLRLPLTFEEAKPLKNQWIECLTKQTEWPFEKFMIALREEEVV